jgi:hypothetical protein
VSRGKNRPLGSQYLLRDAIEKERAAAPGISARRPVRWPSERRETVMATKGKADLVTRAQQLSAGVAKHLANQTQVVFTGGPFTPAQITTRLQSIVTMRADVDAAKATTRAKVAAERADMTSQRAFTGALAAYVKVTFGGSPEVLADFGIAPKARAPLTVEAKAAAAAKRAATRAARGTMGTKQRLLLRRGTRGIPLKFAPRVASAASL